jgi:hypothetical protein
MCLWPVLVGPSTYLWFRVSAMMDGQASKGEMTIAAPEGQNADRWRLHFARKEEHT